MQGTCVECKKPFKAHRYDADYCSTPCRNKFNNRRRDRGAELYDLAMIEERDPAFYAKYLTHRREVLMSKWLAEDDAADMKRTHKRPNDVVQSGR